MQTIILKQSLVFIVDFVCMSENKYEFAMLIIRMKTKQNIKHRRVIAVLYEQHYVNNT